MKGSFNLSIYILIFICGVCAACFKKQVPTFEKDIAPIVYGNCTKCHNPNGIAPFSLTNFENIKK
jgi:hypothetical protein